MMPEQRDALMEELTENWSWCSESLECALRVNLDALGNILRFWLTVGDHQNGPIGRKDRLFPFCVGVRALLQEHMNTVKEAS